MSGGLWTCGVQGKHGGHDDDGGDGSETAQAGMGGEGETGASGWQKGLAGFPTWTRVLTHPIHALCEGAGTELPALFGARR
jgi:hypothetical protein